MQLHTTPYDSMLMTYWSKLRSNDEVFRNWNDEIPICGSCIVFPFFLPRCSLTFGKVGPLLRPALCVCDLNPALIHKTRAYIRQSHRIFSMIFHQKTSRVGYLLFFSVSISKKQWRPSFGIFKGDFGDFLPLSPMEVSWNTYILQNALCKVKFQQINLSGKPCSCVLWRKCHKTLVWICFEAIFQSTSHD